MKCFVYIILIISCVSCSEKKQEIPLAFYGPHLEININKANYKKLVEYRKQALKNKVIDKNLKKYIKGFITYKGTKTSIKLRLKGDWLDHLKGNKWSFRIKIEGQGLFIGLKSFSIQSPHTRSFLHEWFMHRICLKENVLTTRYEFIPVRFNGKEMGIYALEEHFDKQLVEAKNRREGPMLKFNEEGIWEARIGTPETFHNLPYFDAAEVVPFKKNRTLNSPVLKEHFKTAQNLMLRHKSFDPNIEEYFDLDKLAKFYALTDIANSDHPLIWHNLRFYYNPVSKKLEPIAYDFYPESFESSVRHPIFGHNNNPFKYNDFYINYYLFNNNEFKTLYVSYLNKYSKENYLNDVFEELQPELDSLETMLKFEYPKAVFNKEFYYKNIENIWETIPEFSNSTQKYKLALRSFDNLKDTSLYYYNMGLKAYSNPFQDSLKNDVLLFNFHSTPVKVIGYGLNKNRDSLFLIKTPLIIKQHEADSKQYKLTLPDDAKTIFFIAKNRQNDTLHTAISQWAFSIDQVSSEYYTNQ